MYISLLALGIKDWFISILDNIPRIIYFFFAAFTSGIDVLQCILRKLAGLDTYWTTTTSGTVGSDGQVSTTVGNKNPVFGRDPLTEFIYGTLGIGDSSVAYKALNTVFISLSIFALIVLAVSTMVAIIKSHYSEEYQNTNPWKYIYTAIKSVLTYAILPVVVVIGLQLSGLILRTLDNITAGTSTEKVAAIYGSNVVSEKFYKEKVTGSNKEYYTRYDFFGAGTATTSQTFGGMLFNAAAYSSNRARGVVAIEGLAQKITTAQAAKSGIFAQSSCAEYSKLTTVEEKQEYLAYQVDFAFANNIGLKQRMSIDTVQDWFPDVRYFKSTDFVGFGLVSISSFSKFNVPLVWMFYDLWQFQFIVAFGGGASVLGVMLSIIIGMMTRLIKGAVLFLLYPPVLSIAPLDNFKAFKSWGGEFMKQILMAYGTVVGFNLLMIVLPLVQNISWFGPGMGVIDALINMVILIVGLLMTKDIIGIVSGFVGGGNAAEEGEKYKSQVAGAVKTGFSASATIGAGVIRGTVGTARLAGGMVKGIGVKTTELRDKRALDYAEEKKGHLDNAKVFQNEIDNAVRIGTGGKKKDDTETVYTREAQHAYETAKLEGKSDEEAKQIARDSVIKKMKSTQESIEDENGNFVLDENGNQKKQSYFDRRMQDQRKKVEAVEEKFNAEKGEKRLKRAEKAREKVDANGELKYKQDQFGHYSKTSRTGKEKRAAAWDTTKGIAKMGVKGLDNLFDFKKGGKQLGDAFLKSVTKMGQVAGVDKMISGMKDIFKDSMTMTTKKFSGDNLAKENQKKTEAKLETQTKAISEQTKILQEIVKSNKDLNKANKEGFNSLANVLRENKSKDKGDSSSDKKK